MRIFRPLIVALIAFLGVAPGRADLITWGGGLGNQFLTSQSAALDSSFWFELGTFDTVGSFAPTDQNVADWANHWHVFDRATTSGVGPAPQWDPNVPLLAGSASITTGGVTSKEADLALTLGDPNYVAVTPGYDFRGQNAYIWAFNDRRTDVGAQWGLFSGMSGDPASPWAFPTTIDVDCGCTGMGADFNLVNITSNVLGTSTQNGDGTTTLQLAVVPEPGGAILLFSAGAVLLIKRKRFRARR